MAARRRRRNPMPPALKAYWAGRRTSRRRRSNPRRARRRHHHHFAMNPRRRRRRYVNRRRFHHRRNPRAISFSTKGIMREYVMPAGIGALGAVGLKIGWGYLAPNLPTALQSGMGAAAAQAGVVLVAGYGLSHFMPRRRQDIQLGVVGALTVIAYGIAVQLLQQYAPTLQGLRDYTDYGMGAYMAPSGVMALPASPQAAASRMAPRIGAMVNPGSVIRPAAIGAYMTYGGVAGYGR